MRRIAAAAVATLALAGCTRGCGPRSAQERVAVTPLPEPPQLDIAPEALPGAGGELAVVAARPQGPMEGDVRPTITFSKPVVALGSVELEKGLPTPITVEPKIDGEWRWLGSATTELVPRGRVPYATVFTVTVPKGLRSVDGSTLAEPHTFTFETPRPAVQKVEPKAGFRWLEPRQAIAITVNQPLRDLARSLRLRVGDDAAFPFDVKEVRVAEEERAARPQRRWAPLSAEQRGFEDRRTRYEVIPRRPMPLDSEVTLSVVGPVAGAEGTLALEGSPSWPFRTYGPFRVTGVETCWWSRGRACPRGPVRLLTTNRFDAKTLAASVKFTPEVAIDWEGADWVTPTEVHLPAVFAPGTRYRVQVSAAAKDAFGQAIAAPFEGSFETSDVPPEYDVGNRLALLETKGDGNLPVTATNVSHVDVRLWPLDPASLARALGTRSKDAPSGPFVEHRVDTSARRNHQRTAPIPVRQLLADSKATIFALMTDAPDVGGAAGRWPRTRGVVGQVTDLAVHAKLGATKGLAWVTRLSDGKPVAGARLALYDRTGTERWTGTTDGDGLAGIPGLATLLPGDGQDRWETPFALVSAELEGDTGVTLSTWSSGLDPSAFELPTDWEGSAPTALGGVFPERGIYRPGETVHVKGVLRTRRLGKIETPSGGTARVTVRSSRGKEIFAKDVPLSAFGTFSADVPVDADAPLGGYAVTAVAVLEETDVSLGGSFRVEEYRAPQFQVDVLSPSRSLAAGEPLKAQVMARYLFGGAMPEAAVRWSVTRWSTPFEPPGNPGFAFGTLAWGWDDEQPEPVSSLAASGQGETDASGLLAVDAGVVEAPGGRTFTYTVEAEVTDVNRQRIANRTTVTVHPASAYAGVRRRASAFAEAGKEDVLEIVAASPEGARRAGVAVKVEVKRREWRWIRKKGVGGAWRVETEIQEERVGGCDVKTRDVPVECRLVPPKPGLYVVDATLEEGSRKQTTRFPFYAVGPGWVSWQRQETDRLDLVPDRRKYEPGDVARVLVKSPYPEAEAVLTVEREGVLSARRVKLSGAANTLEVPISEEHVPNVFVSVVLVRGRVPDSPGRDPGAPGTPEALAGPGQGGDPGRPEVRVGYARLEVEKRSRRLDVSVVPDAAEKRPRDKVSVDLRVTDHRGNGAQAELAVWAVDEGILRLTGYEAPDPVELVHRPRGLSVRIGEPLIHLVERVRYGAKGESTGGGGGGDDGAGAGFRSRFETTVLFAPSVVTDASGRARVAFDLPDNLTTYRIMAVAVSRSDRMGVGQAKVAVAKPLMALPALPRLARTGDRFEAGVVVHAPTGKVDEVEVKAEATGVALEGAAARTVSLRDGKPREVRFTFTASAPGEAVLRFAVRGGGERDGVEQRFPVHMPVELEAVATYGDTRDVRREALVPPGGVRPDAGGLEVTLASTALAGFSENMRQLVEYPYGCLEQLSSRLVPFIALREIQGKLGLPHHAGAKPAEPPAWARAWLGEEVFRVHETADPDEVVRRTVKAIERLQNPDGGYRYWASSACSAEWASSYAVLALGRAAALGFPVDREGLRRGQAYLAGTVAAGLCTRCGVSCTRPWDATRVFALHALARTGAPRASYYGEMFANREALPLFAQAMLADAMFVGQGDRQDARKLLQEILNHAKETPSEIHFEESDALTYATLWSSDTRTTGIVLSTLADVAPDHPFVAKMAAHLAKVRKQDGRFRNTQEAAFALMALAEVARTKEKEVPSFTARVTLGGKTIAEAPFEGRSTEVRTVKVGMKDLPRAKEPLPFDFRRDGKAGVLYYGALVRYAPAEVPKEPLERGLFVQRWVEPYAGGGQVRAARAGELVRFRVRIGSAQERHYVAVSVPLPAGLEIVDTTLATTARAAAPPAGEEDGEGSGEGYELENEEDLSEDGQERSFANAFPFGFWSPFNFEERRDDRLVLFADRLPPGVHVASFVARATTPGRFVLSPAHAEEMYTPEVFGRSDGGTFEVIANEQVAGR